MEWTCSACQMLNPEGVSKCTACLTVKKQEWTCECGSVNPNKEFSCSFCLKLNPDRLQKNFARLQRKHGIVLTSLAEKDRVMSAKEKANNQTISQLKRQLQDLSHSYQHLERREKRLRFALQDANFDLQDAKRLVSQLQNRSKTQDSILGETVTVASDLHKQLQAELRRAKESHAKRQEFDKAQETLKRLKVNKENFKKLELTLHQPAHIEHIVLQAFQPKNPNDIKVLCDHASERARAVVKKDNLGGVRHDKFNRPVDAFNLCEEEISAIHLYTQNAIIYKPFNAAARAGQIAQYQPYWDLLLAAHQKMPVDPQPRVLYRGVTVDLQKAYPPQSKFTWMDFTSWSTSQGTAAGFARRDDGGRATMFCVSSNNGKCVTKYSEYHEEEEFLLPPNMTFSVKQHEQYTSSSTGMQHILITLEHATWSR